MTNAQCTLSAFADEIALPLEEQLETLRALNIRRLDLRAAWGVNVLYLSDDQVSQIKRLCQEAGVEIACIGSPIGKSPLTDPMENELNNLRRIMQVAEALGTRHIRIFSFYPPDTSSNAHYDQHVPEAAARLYELTKLAQQQGFYLLHENEKDIVGDTPARCLELLRSVEGLHCIWDPANFVQVGVGKQVDQWWGELGPRVDYVHIKDARLNDGGVVAAGEGDGQVRELLTRLRDAGYQGVLSLEPHLEQAGRSGGFTGAAKMAYAVSALRGLMAEVGLPEV